MATTATSSHSTKSSTCDCTVPSTDQLARAECYLRIEEQNFALEQAIALRREDENEKLFVSLCGVTTPLTVAKLAEVTKARATALAQIDADAAALTQVNTLLNERIGVFMKSTPEAFRAALEKRRQALDDQLSSEQLNTTAIEKRIKVIDKRLADLPPCPPDHPTKK